MNEILSMDISSGRGYSDEDCRMYESALCAAVFRTDNPVARCIHREVNFDSVPFPSRGAVDGFTHITGLANPVFLTMLACHPDSKVKKNVVMATVPPEKFELFLQNAFLSYLAAFRNRSELGYVLLPIVALRPSTTPLRAKLSILLRPMFNAVLILPIVDRLKPVPLKT